MAEKAEKLEAEIVDRVVAEKIEKAGKSAPKSPEDLLRKLEATVKHEDATVLADTKRNAGKKEDLAVLREAWASARAKLTAYEQSFGELQKHKEDLESFHRKVASHGKNDEVDASIKWYEDKQKLTKGKIERSQDELDKARKDRDKADQELNDARAAFTNLQEKQAFAEGKIQELEGIKQKIDSATSDARTYFMVRELGRLLAEIDIPSQEDFSKELVEAFEAYMAKAIKAREDAAVVERLQADFERENDKFLESEKNGRLNIFNALPEINS